MQITTNELVPRVTDVDYVKAAAIVPRFFASGDCQLFGVYHPPDGTRLRNEGVVLCYPGPQEYAQVHWAFQKLAKLLSDAGFHVLRFDYSSTGDSFGVSADASLTAWAEDITAAVGELRELAGIRRVSVVGMRLGANLALRAIGGGLKVRHAVLWEPILSGREYVRLLDALEDVRLSQRLFPESNQRVSGELLGYAFTDAMRADTERLDLMSDPIGRIERVMLVGPRMTEAHSALQRRFEEAGVGITTATVDDPTLYDAGKDPRDTILSHNIPVAITEYLAGRQA